MAVNVTDAQIVKLIDNVLSEQERTVSNTGASPVFCSRDPQLVAGGASTFTVNPATEEDITLKPGQALYAICGAGLATTVEVR